MDGSQQHQAAPGHAHPGRLLLLLVQGLLLLLLVVQGLAQVACNATASQLGGEQLPRGAIARQPKLMRGCRRGVGTPDRGGKRRSGGGVGFTPQMLLLLLLLQLLLLRHATAMEVRHHQAWCCVACQRVTVHRMASCRQLTVWREARLMGLQAVVQQLITSLMA